MNNSDIRDITLFARNQLHKIIDKEDLPKYYGLYWKNPSLFEIVPGYKHVLSLLFEYCKKKLLHKDTVEKMYKVKERLIKKTKKRSQILPQLSSNLNHANTSTSHSSSVISEEMDDDLSTSEQASEQESSESIIWEENKRIRKAIVSWIQGKVTKDGWLALRESIDKISIKTSLDASELNCAIKCFCGANYIISKFAKKNSKFKCWIYSNFQTHLLKKHIQNTNSFATKSFVNKKNRITDYVTKVPSKISNAKVSHNIEFINKDNVNKSQQVNNKDDKVEVIGVKDDKVKVVDMWKYMEYMIVDSGS